MIKDTANKAVTSTKKFVRKHKTAITVIATSTAWIAINRRALREHDNFLKEHGLYEEFYYPTDEEMGVI